MPVGGFYDLDAAQRRELTAAAVAERRTLLERWKHIDQEGTAAWDERAGVAASMLDDVASVLDLGCGLMYLERHLREGVRYLPVDVVARDGRTILVDLNVTPLPALDADCAVALGLLEYLHNVPGLLREMAKYRRVVVSYSPMEKLPDLAERQAHAWVSHLSESALEAAFADTGLVVLDCREFRDVQTIWSLYAKARR